MEQDVEEHVKVLPTLKTENKLVREAKALFPVEFLAANFGLEGSYKQQKVLEQFIDLI